MSTNLSPVLKLVNLPSGSLALEYFKEFTFSTFKLFNALSISALSNDKGMFLEVRVN